MQHSSATAIQTKYEFPPLPTVVSCTVERRHGSLSMRSLLCRFPKAAILFLDAPYVCRSAHVEIRRISSIRQYLTVEATKTLVSVFVLSKLEYCNSLLSGCPLYNLRRPQKSSELCSKTCLQNHADVIMCNFFFKLFIGYRSRPE